MRSRHHLGIAVLLVAWCTLGVRTGAENGSDPLNLGGQTPFPPPDEKTLQEGKVGTDGPALLEFVRSRTLSDAERAKLAETVRRLGHNDFDVREKASEDLVKAG